jgi:hypothetical protein
MSEKAICTCDVAVECPKHGEVSTPAQGDRAAKEILRLRERVREIAESRDALKAECERLRNALDEIKTVCETSREAKQGTDDYGDTMRLHDITHLVAGALAPEDVGVRVEFGPDDKARCARCHAQDYPLANHKCRQSEEGRNARS